MATKKVSATPDARARSLSSRDFVSVTIYMPRELRQTLKRAAVDVEQPVSKIVIEAIEAHLAKSKKL